MEDVLAFAALPLAAAALFPGIQTWFGLQVLRRNVVFADLALAQVSALGATVGAVGGHPVSSVGGYAYSLLFAAGGALLLTASRALSRSVRQEAFIGVLYVVATAATVLVVDRSPQGAEHVKKILVGGILSVSAGDVVRLLLLYCAIGAVHWLIRRPLLAAADETPGGGGATAVCDLFGRHRRRPAGVLLPYCSGARRLPVLVPYRGGAGGRVGGGCDCERGRNFRLIPDRRAGRRRHRACLCLVAHIGGRRACLSGRARRAAVPQSQARPAHERPCSVRGMR